MVWSRCGIVRSRYSHCTVEVRSWYGHGAVMVRSCCGHGTVAVQSKYGRGTVEVSRSAGKFFWDLQFLQTPGSKVKLGMFKGLSTLNPLCI